MKHEVLFLNSSRTYVRIQDVWYDTHKEHNPKVGQAFLTGDIEEVLDYESYTAAYPESKTEIFYIVNDKTQARGAIRKVEDRKMGDGTYERMVQYAVNPLQPSLFTKQDIELN